MYVLLVCLSICMFACVSVCLSAYQSVGVCICRFAWSDVMWAGLMWFGLVWSGLIWSGVFVNVSGVIALVRSGLVCMPVCLF